MVKRWLGDSRLPLAIVLIMAATAFIVLMRYAALADFRELALDRLQDDSFYYLQPAWDFAARHFFTFDGKNPTYGFQPLWMLVLTFQAAFVPDKISFLRASVGLGALFYSLTGIGLYLLARRWMGAWAALLAPAAWLFNANLAGLYITGKENALYAFLLVASAALIARRLSRPSSPRAAWVDGVVLGFMVLSRVNALVVAVLMGALILFASHGAWSERVRRTLWLALGSGVVLGAWGAYAWFAFGTLFPNSGTAKLFGSWAALAVFIHRHATWLSLERLAALLPAGERVFLGNPAALVLPTRGLAESFFLGYLPEVTLGALTKLWPFASAASYQLRLLLLAALGLTFIAWLAYSVLHMRTRRREMQMTEAGGAALAVGVVALAAAINGASNLLLLPAYLYWGSWYAVPEQLTLVIAAATSLWLAARILAGVVQAATRWITLRIHRAMPAQAWLPYIGGAAIIAGTVVLGINFDRPWRPAPYKPIASSIAGYNAVRWMNANLPRGSRVASYSSGVLGYFAEGYAVINIDGLANTPQFVENESRGHLLYQRGLAAQDPLVDYLKRAGVTHLANAEPEMRILSGPYLGLVDTTSAAIVYEGAELIDWGPQEPPRHFIVVELHPSQP
jgi:hypothetical protein